MTGAVVVPEVPNSHSQLESIAFELAQSKWLPSSSLMLDDGLNGDGLAGDGVFGAKLPTQPDKTVVEFYVQASDPQGGNRTWPAATDETGAQGANALYRGPGRKRGR